MTDEIPEDEPSIDELLAKAEAADIEALGDYNPGLEEILDDALLLVQESIEHLLSLMGEDSDSILTDWAIVCVSQGFSPDGRPLASDTMVLPKRFLPGYRIKGLLVDALDQYRNSEMSITVVHSNDDEDEDE